MHTVGNLIAVLFIIAILARIVGGPGAAGKVMAGPFVLLGWLLRGILGAAGQGAKAVVRDTHRHNMRVRPGATLRVYWIAGAVVLGLLALALLSAGCSGVKPATISWGEAYTYGHRTPVGAKVPEQEWTVSGPGISVGTGFATSGGPTGTIEGYRPDGRYNRQKFGGR